MRHRSQPPVPAAGTILGLATQNRRHHIRQAMRSLAYVKLDSANRGVVRDVSESGIAAQTLINLEPGERLQLQIELPGPNLCLETEGRVAWFDPAGQAGIEFVELAPHSRQLLKEWIFAQLLADAHRVASPPLGLSFSQPPRAAISLKEPATLPPRTLDRGQSIRLRLLGVPVSLRSFSTLVDGMVLLCAILLFSVLALTLTETLPAWPVATLLVTGVSAVFAGLYWFLFYVWFGITPGTRLADLASRDVMRQVGQAAEKRVRFR